MTEQPLSPSPHPLPRGERENKSMFATEQQPCPTPSPDCGGPLYMAPTLFLALFVMPNGVDLPAAGGYVGGQTEEDAETLTILRRHGRTDRPWADPRFLARLEKQLSRRLVPRRPGRPRKGP